MTTRSELKKLVSMRLDEAQVLFANKRYCGAYYVAGYAIECAIKVVIVKEFRANQIPDKDRVRNTYQHNLKNLIEVAGLASPLNREMRTNAALFANWNTVKDWSEKSRYNPSIRALKARDMLTAINDPTNGVLAWLKRHW